jgi:hypothetical protein
MLFIHLVRAGEIGDRSGHPSHTICSPPGEYPNFDTTKKELTGTTIEGLAVEINPAHVTIHDPTLVLCVASRHDAAPNIARRLAGWAQ